MNSSIAFHFDAIKTRRNVEIMVQPNENAEADAHMWFPLCDDDDAADDDIRELGLRVRAHIKRGGASTGEL